MKAQHILHFIMTTTVLLTTNSGWTNEQKIPYFTANYKANIKGFSISATRVFRPLKEGEEVELILYAKSWLANLTETSRFIWDEEKIKPSGYHYRQTVLGQSKKRSLSFDYANQTITSYDNDKETTISNTEAILDKLSFQLQLQYDLLSQPDTLVYRVVDKGRIKDYQFEIIKTEMISTQIGPINSTKVKVVRENQNRLTYFWLAPKWYNLLIRMEQYEHGKKESELQLTNAVIDGQTVKGNTLDLISTY